MKVFALLIFLPFFSLKLLGYLSLSLLLTGGVSCLCPLKVNMNVKVKLNSFIANDKVSNVKKQKW